MASASSKADPEIADASAVLRRIRTHFCSKIGLNENALSSDFVKHSSNFGLPEALLMACSEGSFGAKSAQNHSICEVFNTSSLDFFQKPWFLQHSVGGALCGHRGPGAKVDECLRKLEKIGVPTIGPESQTPKVHEIKQRPSNKQATNKQSPSQ